MKIVCKVCKTILLLLAISLTIGLLLAISAYRTQQYIDDLALYNSLINDPYSKVTYLEKDVYFDEVQTIIIENNGKTYKFYK